MKLSRQNHESGQSLVEYVMMLIVVIGLASLLGSRLPKLMGIIQAPFKDAFARTYKYGDPLACGYDGDPPACSGPMRHPRYLLPGSARMFARGR